MQKPRLMFTLLAAFLFFQAAAQNVPAGFKTGTIFLADGTSLTGLIRSSLKNGQLNWISTDGHSKKKFSSADINGFDEENDHYTTVQSDLFKVIQDGTLCLLQKASDVSGQLHTYGSESILLTGTPGKPGDYFLCNKSTRELQQVNASEFAAITQKFFGTNPAALEKATAAQTDFSLLKPAVEIFNAGH